MEIHVFDIATINDSHPLRSSISSSWIERTELTVSYLFDELLLKKTVIVNNLCSVLSCTTIWSREINSNDIQVADTKRGFSWLLSVPCVTVEVKTFVRGFVRKIQPPLIIQIANTKQQPSTAALPNIFHAISLFGFRLRSIWLSEWRYNGNINIMWHIFTWCGTLEDHFRIKLLFPFLCGASVCVAAL